MSQKQLKIKRRLVDIVEDFRKLLLTIHDNEGEVERSLLKELRNCEEALETKVESCLLVAEEFAAQHEAYKKRAKALDDHAKAMENRSKKLRDMVKEAMIALQIHKMKTPSFSSVYLKEFESLAVLDLDRVLELFEDDEEVVQYLDPRITKRALKKRLEDPAVAKTLKGAVETRTTTGLMVR